MCWREKKTLFFWINYHFWMFIYFLTVVNQTISKWNCSRFWLSDRHGIWINHRRESGNTLMRPIWTDRLVAILSGRVGAVRLPLHAVEVASACICMWAIVFVRGNFSSKRPFSLAQMITLEVKINFGQDIAISKSFLWRIKVIVEQATQQKRNTKWNRAPLGQLVLTIV